MIEKWIRKCDECNHTQEDKPPDRTKELPISYTNRKCKKCKSEALDYGTYRFYDESGKEIESDEE